MRQRTQLNSDNVPEKVRQLAHRRRLDREQDSKSRTGPKLTAAQRVLLLKTLALYDDFRIVREALREEDPTFPDLNDSTLRRYRQKKDKRTLERMEAAFDEALTRSVADKRRRLAELSRRYQRYTRRAWELEQTLKLPEKDWDTLRDPSVPPLLRELRKLDALAGATLRQIMAETGMQPSRAANTGTLAGDGVNLDDVEDTYLEELIADIINDRIAEEKAWEEAERMQKLMDNVDLG